MALCDHCGGAGKVVGYGKRGKRPMRTCKYCKGRGQTGPTAQPRDGKNSYNVGSGGTRTLPTTFSDDAS